MASSLISSEVDFDTDGKQAGYLRLPHSTHVSAYGWQPIPITVLKNGDGPTLLIMAGNHGDEYEGQIAVSKLAQALEADDIRGRLILMPMTNAPAARAGTRTSPIDGGNLNRAFPGDPTGTPTQMLAHYVESELLPLADFMVDLHSGGTSLFYPPTLLRGMGHSPDETDMLRRLQEAMDLPYAWVFTSGGGLSSTARTAMAAANRNGVVSVMTELGGGGAVSPEILAQTERGLRRVLNALGMLPGYAPDATRGTREMHAAGVVSARDAGLFEPLKEISDDVADGEVVARVHFPETPHRTAVEVTTPYSGMVLCKRVLARVEIGDALYQIAYDAESG